MIFKTFGERNKPVVIFIQGALTSWHLLQPISDELAKQYTVVVPILDGHDSESDSTFTTIQKTATDISGYVTNNFSKHVHGIIGFSLGGTIATEIISRELLIVDKIILDSAFLAPMKPMIAKLATSFMVSQVGRMQHRKKSLYPILPIGTQVLDSLSRESAHNVFSESYNYHITKQDSAYSPNIIYLYGSKEARFSKASYNELLRYYPNAQYKVFQNYAHGDLIFKHQNQFASETCSFLHSEN